MRLNLGSGETPLEGYENLDRKTGQEVYPLPFEDESVDEIRASHVLEHFPHREVGGVLAEWVRVLKPGGILKIAVPNFEWIAQHYLAGSPIPTEGYTMGGQVDENDFHKALFDAESLTAAMRAAGLRGIHEWTSDAGDCAALAVSLNLQGTKASPVTPAEVRDMQVRAAMSVPRLGFMDNFFCVFSALMPLGIPLRKHTGVFWGQCLERCMLENIAEGANWILTVDYDTVFTQQDVLDLLQLARDNPDAHAIAALQAHRLRNTALMSIEDDDGNRVAQISHDEMRPDLMAVSTAHFGLTLINVERLQAMPAPWFAAVPGEDGTWTGKKTDEDIYFWRGWKKAGNSLYVANHVVVGHAELMIQWPDRNLQTIYQHPSEFYKTGAPEESWK